MDELKIKSNVRDYKVIFSDNFTRELQHAAENNTCFFVVDELVFQLYRPELEPILPPEKMFLMRAAETNKTLDKAQEIIRFLLKSGYKRNHKIIAIGGGITQDVTCFVASVLFRGVNWELYPTTLLAQCDSCIGSKSSINVGEFKNQVGTFYPPEKIVLDTNFLDTLAHEDILSGLGEAIKVHYLDPDKTFNEIFKSYDSSPKRSELTDIIKKSLLIKQRIIEVDEYDRDYRNILNYGHTFGHALESATDYKIPHGVAVTIGMGIANFVSLKLGFLSSDVYEKMQTLIDENSKEHLCDLSSVSIDTYWSALKKDKKNIDGNIGVIITRGFGETFKKQMALDGEFKEIILEYLENVKIV